MYAASLNLLPRLCLERFYLAYCFKHYLSEHYRWRCDFSTAEFVIYNEPEDFSQRQQYKFPMVLLGTQSSLSDTFKFVYQHFEGGDRKRVDGKAVKVGGTQWQDHVSLAQFGDDMRRRAAKVEMYELCTAPALITPDVMPGGIRGGRGGEGWIVIEDEVTTKQKEQEEKERAEKEKEKEAPVLLPQLLLTPGGLVRVTKTLCGTAITCAAMDLFSERHFVSYNFAVDAEASGYAYVMIENPFKLQFGEEKDGEKKEGEQAEEKSEKEPVLSLNLNSANDSSSALKNPVRGPNPFIGWPTPLPPMPWQMVRSALELALDHYYDILTDHKEALRLMLASPLCCPSAFPLEEHKGLDEGEEVLVLGTCFQVVFEPSHPNHRILRVEPIGTKSF